MGNINLACQYVFQRPAGVGAIKNLNLLIGLFSIVLASATKGYLDSHGRNIQYRLHVCIKWSLF